jgi:hypothetical protein
MVATMRPVNEFCNQADLRKSAANEMLVNEQSDVIKAFYCSAGDKETVLPEIRFRK